MNSEVTYNFLMINKKKLEIYKI